VGDGVGGVTGGVAGGWGGGAFGERGTCVLAPNAGPMTLDGTNTWVLREPGARRTVVVDPGPAAVEHLDAVAAAAGERQSGRVTATAAAIAVSTATASA
jgi:hypothetical protein